ncbi:hypothetical protein CEUSTIGMA_g7336.t1 [Chlamydomonas eustigma]|uniref:RWD domain-containing protein n=1 Tax=Chlamydomonas eustigma TaxID=1157962 RepID=A0A250XA26_9CHLO|nr:hypothetical protein CEUSTIGMA_g7336.t1 [Chlamydomonas eustigma]|eukprot:GAX79896.1 hypothetical protein CEUSTIGMA_g7336.t1 [Chlamydomonas eustigma]
MPTELQCLRTQVEELEALAATFTEEGAVQFQTLEAEALKLAKEAVVGNAIPARSLPLLSGTIRIPGIHVQGGPLSLRFVLPTAYPLQCATLSVECSCSRSIHEELGQVVRRVAEDSEGAECLLLEVSELRDAAQTLHPKSGPSLVTESAQPFKDLGSSEYSDAAHRSTGHEVEIVRVVIWFHHIKSLQKRRFIVDRARSLGVTGYSKPGFPGVTFIYVTIVQLLV